MSTGSHYTVLARRFRPQAFSDVVGQEHIAKALTNAIRGGRVAHAYMFTGARGVGKTSTARILAKALNCPHVVDGVPCNQCEICDGISAGNDVDVLEIDGASNRGIDDIRMLRANVGVRSMRTPYKVYIIDEVHMLTKEAFNALLKTLEEPPPNVKFVFCTTEPNKVPDTILSRCQRFDFSSIADQSIADRLREIAKAEGFEVSEEALELVARRARGSMRDSQSLFDQLLAFSDGEVSAADVHRMLGTAGDERLVELFDAMVEHRPGEVMSLLESTLLSGVQPGELMEQAIGYVRDLMIVATGGDSVGLCSVSGRYRPVLANQAVKLGMHGIMAAFQILADARNQMFRSTFARTVLEMAMVQVGLLENLSAISDLLSGRLPALPEISASSPSEEKKKSESTSAVVISSSVEIRSPATEDAEGADDEDLQSEDADDDEPEMVDRPAATLISQDSERPPHQSSEASGSGTPLSEETLNDLLQELVKSVGLTISAGLKRARGLVIAGSNRLEVLLDQSADFARKVLDQPEHRMRIESEIRRITGQTVSIGIRMTQLDPDVVPDRTPVASVSAPAKNRTAESEEPSRRSARNEAPPAVNLLGDVDPSQDVFVRQVMEAFGATVVKVTAAPLVQATESIAAEG